MWVSYCLSTRRNSNPFCFFITRNFKKLLFLCGICACMKAIGWLWILLSNSLCLVSGDTVWNNLKLSRLAILAVPKALGSFCFCLPALGLQVCAPTPGFLVWVQGIRTLVLILVSQALYPLSTPTKCVCVCVRVCVCAHQKLLGVGSFLLPCGSHRLGGNCL